MNPQEFMDWLKEKEFRFFRKANPCCCPLAEWQAEKHKGMVIFVNSTEFRISRNRDEGEWKNLPMWAIRFVERTDEGHEICNVIAAWECLGIMEGIKRQMEREGTWDES